MNTRDLTYFVALAEHKHFGKAAKACFVSQPSLSIQIKKLEESLGVALFERTNRSVLLTGIGKVIAEQARMLLQQAVAIKETANQAKDPFSGKLNLGVIPTLTTYILPHLMPDLVKTESFPKLSIFISELKTQSLLAHVKEGKLDAALISLPLPPDHEDLVMHSLFEDNLLLAVSKKHPLAQQKMIKQSDLKKQSLLLLEEGHCLRDQALSICHTTQEAKHFKATNLEVIRYMVASNSGNTLMPQIARKSNDGICYLPIAAPQSKRTIAIVWRKTSGKRLLLEKITLHIKNLMAEHRV